MVDDDTVLCGTDLLPTFCKLGGMDLPAGIQVDGEDMSTVFRGEKKERTSPLMWEWRFRVYGHCIHRSPILAIRDGNWKLLVNPDDSRIELYDIPNDVTELNNVAEKHPDVVKRLSARVKEWAATLPEGPIQPTAGSNAYPWPESG